METNSIIRYSVFFPTLFVVCLSLVPTIFPALLVKSFSPYEIDLPYFEFGPNVIPILLGNFVLIGLGIAYYKKKLSPKILRSIEFILNFEVSKKTALIIAIIILSIYFGVTIPELSLNEEDSVPDFQILKKALEIWPYGETDDPYIKEQNDRYVRMFLLDISNDLFKNIKLLPFFASILLVIVTYFFTYQISHKRFAGLISMVVLLQSYTFLEYDTIAVYENFWVLFYVMSLYILFKKWYLSSPVWYILSIFTKAFAAPFVFMNLFFICRSRLSKKKKIFTLLLYLVIITASVLIFIFGDTIYGELVRVDFLEFLLAFTVFSYQLRFDYLLIIALLPLTIGLFLTSKRGIKHADSILFLFLGFILAGPFLSLLTDFYVILPYRFVPLIVFFSIGVGIFFSKNTT